MKSLLAIATLIAGTIGVHAQTCNAIATSILCDNGLSGLRVGDTTFWNDGVISHHFGGTTLNSDGTTSNRIGASSTKMGNTILFSDGRSCTRVGASFLCN